MKSTRSFGVSSRAVVSATHTHASDRLARASLLTALAAAGSERTSPMTPTGMDRDEARHQQLKLIDTYLLNETGKATLKSAIELIKPIYLEYC